MLDPLSLALIGGAVSLFGSAISAGVGYASAQETTDKQLKQQMEMFEAQSGLETGEGSGFQMLPIEIPDYGVDAPQQPASISSVIGSTGIGQPPMTGGGYNQPPPPALF
jgi:hypothetical protein|tara:strand:- start:2840 stop:3166 length:327 start_codon:yes stop_codon:yes gene_type:complete